MPGIIILTPEKCSAELQIPLDQKFTKPLESYESKQNEKILQSCNKTSLGHETCG